MELTTDSWVLWQWGVVEINATIAFTWLVMALLTGVSWAITRHLSPGIEIGRGQVVLEVIVTNMRKQVDEVAPGQADRLLPFVGTLFLFIATSNVLLVVPFYRPPTGSLSTTSALAFAVFVAVPIFGVARLGLGRYLGQYVQPSVLMLPFNILGELSRTLALSVRLFGNIMSGTLIGAVLLSLAPLLFPVLLQALGLLTGLIQAYVFAVLTLIYLASATRARGASGPEPVGVKADPGRSSGDTESKQGG